MADDTASELERAQQSERRFRSLVAAAAAQAVWVANPNGEYEEDSPSWRELTGQTWEEFRGRGFLAAIHPDDRQAVNDVWQGAIQSRTGYHTEYRLRMRNGDYRWFAARAVPVYEAEGAVTEWVGTSTDIHDQREREATTRILLEAEEVFASSLDERVILRKLVELAVPRLADWCAADLIDETGAVQRIASEHRDPLKRELAHQIVRHYPPKSDISVGLVEAARSGRPQLYPDVSDEVLTTMTTSQEHRQTLLGLGINSYMLVPLEIRGSIVGAISFGDAESTRTFGPSDLALAEELAHRVAIAVDNARLYSDARGANRAKDLFLAMLSHEMKTPLTAILGWARILKMDDPQGDSREAVDAIEQSALVQQRLIEDLLDVSRVISGKLHLEMSVIDLREVVRRAVETVQPQAKEKSIPIRTQMPDDPMRAEGDATRLQQVFWNLLTNALKFTPDGGLIEVTAMRESDLYIINVRDTGRGIKPEILPYLFDTFRQSTVEDRSAHKGLGLGLAIVRSVVQMHGGAVEAASEGEGKGSTFIVRLPLHEGDSSGGNDGLPGMQHGRPPE